MRHGLRRSLVAAIAAVAGMAVLAPAAGASIGTPSVTLSPSSATAASTANQGVNIGFSPSSGDSVKNLTLQLPPGLIANASIDGGACLKSATPLAACQVGSGTVTADVNVAPPLVAPALALSAEFTLVAPPAAGDLAGLDVLVKDPISGQYGVLGTPAAVAFRSPSDPAGYGLNIAFSNIAARSGDARVPCQRRGRGTEAQHAHRRSRASRSSDSACTSGCGSSA